MAQMLPAILLALGVAFGASPLAAQDIAVEREELAVLGWSDRCSVALKHLVYPKFGTAIHNEPVGTRVGTLTVEPGEQKGTARWFFEASGPNTFDAARVSSIEGQLAKLGYRRKGYAEVVRPDPSRAQPGLAETLLSTVTLRLRPGRDWPGPGWRWSGADYSPLGTCTLLIFDSNEEPPRKAFLLARTYNPRVRLDRSRAHAQNARLLFSAGELERAAAEAGTAASLAPESAVSRYVNAAMKAMTGRDEEAVSELRAAIERDPRKRKEARSDPDFETLRQRQDFRDLLGSNILDRMSRQQGTDSE